MDEIRAKAERGAVWSLCWGAEGRLEGGRRASSSRLRSKAVYDVLGTYRFDCTVVQYLYSRY